VGLKLDFRSATPEDGAVLLSIHCAAVTELTATEYTPDEIRSWLHGLTAEGYGRSMAQGERIELAIVDERVVGFCGIRLCDIRGLFADPRYVRHGVGSALLQRGLRQLREDGCTLVFVSSSVTAAPFYTRNGFKERRRGMWHSRGGLEIRSVELTYEFH